MNIENKGVPASYFKKTVNGINKKINEIELFKFPNVTIVGSPKIESGQIEGFTTDDYLQFPMIVDVRNRPYSIDMCFTTGSDVTTQQNILDSEFGIALAIQNGRGIMAMSSNGVSWDIGLATGTRAILPNTTYYAKLTWDGDVYRTEISTDGADYITDIVVNSQLGLYPRTIYIGGSYGLFGVGTDHPFKGSINLNNCALTIADLIIWTGMDDAGLATRMAIDMSNIDLAGKKIVEDIVSESESISTINNDLSELDERVTELENTQVVKSVNGEKPDADGNVNVEGGSGGYDDTEIRSEISGLSESIVEISGRVDNIATVSSGEYVPFDYSDKIQSNEGFVNSVNGTLRNGVANFFYTIPIPVTKGQQIKLNGYGSGTNACWLSFWDSETATVGTPIKASVSKVETEYGWTVERDGFVRFSNNVPTATYHLDVSIKGEGGVKLSDETKEAVNEEINKAISKIPMPNVPKTTVITVGIGKDFTSLVDAINSISESSEQNKYIIELYEGRYETVVESEIASGYRGLIIPDWVSIVGIGNRDNIIISGQILNSAYASYAGNISTINLVANGVVENVTIYAKNMRYCNHDDGTFLMVNAKHTFRFCEFIYDTIDDGYVVAGYCVGIGSQKDKEVIFENCEFVILATGQKYGVLIHDNASSAQQTRGFRLTVKDCIFKINDTSYDVRLSNSGGKDDCYTVLTGNKFCKGIRLTNANTNITANRMKMIASGNSKCDILNSTSFDLSEDFTLFNNGI